MKKILLVTDVYGWGGHSRAKYIKKHLSDEFNFTIMDSQEFNRFERNINLERFTFNDVKEYREISADKESFDFRKFENFYKNKKSKKDFDLYYFLFHTMLVKKSVKRIIKNNKKVITIVTGYPTIKPIFGKNSQEREIKFTNLSTKCEAIIANNLISLEDLKKYYKGKTFYAPRGVDPEVFYPIDNQYAPKSNFVVAYVGKPVPEKGLNKFIKPACEQAGVELIINDRNYTNALSPDEMRNFYNRADAYVVASTIDGTPNPALEAASCGRPIISNYIGNMPEFIKHGQNGFIVQDRKVNKYAYFLRKLKENPKLSWRMGMEARKTIEENWTWKKVLENERNIFRSVLHES